MRATSGLLSLPIALAEWYHARRRSLVRAVNNTPADIVQYVRARGRLARAFKSMSKINTCDVFVESTEDGNQNLRWMRISQPTLSLDEFAWVERDPNDDLLEDPWARLDELQPFLQLIGMVGRDPVGNLMI
ncbi:hypothetical protein BKA62DRAFT_818240 [Auriculariales sp. MPI-PUGE-AT-0066]|nr:hypothetical protein BKA62DRAFT_818240 [Auriculariales sp. MPI-PUGE-AT-0066]